MTPTIRDVKSQHAARLLALPGVVSVGLGRGPEGNLVIVIGLDRPRPKTLARLPRTLEGYAVRVEIVGPIKAR